MTAKAYLTQECFQEPPQIELIIELMEGYAKIKLAEQKEHYQELLAIASEEVPKGSVDYDRIPDTTGD